MHLKTSMESPRSMYGLKHLLYIMEVQPLNSTQTNMHTNIHTHIRVLKKTDKRRRRLACVAAAHTAFDGWTQLNATWQDWVHSRPNNWKVFWRRHTLWNITYWKNETFQGNFSFSVWQLFSSLLRVKGIRGGVSIAIPEGKIYSFVMTSQLRKHSIWGRDWADLLFPPRTLIFLSGITFREVFQVLSVGVAFRLSEAQRE